MRLAAAAAPAPPAVAVAAGRLHTAVHMLLLQVSAVAAELLCRMLAVAAAARWCSRWQHSLALAVGAADTLPLQPVD